MGGWVCVILSEAKEPKRRYGSFASLRMTVMTQEDPMLQTGEPAPDFALRTLRGDRMVRLGVDGLCGNYPDRIRVAIAPRLDQVSRA